jgi:uncharacterized protein YndB with AHSA1/START domain
MSDRVRGYAHRVDIEVGVEAVWQALTDSAQLARWCSPEAQVRGRPGGLFRASVDRVTEFEAHIDVFEPGRRLKLIYLPSPGVPRTASVMTDDFILDAVPGGTIVRLLGHGIPADPEWETQYLRLRTGWQQALARLKVLLEHPASGKQLQQKKGEAS